MPVSGILSRVPVSGVLSGSVPRGAPVGRLGSGQLSRSRVLEDLILGVDLRQEHECEQHHRLEHGEGRHAWRQSGGDLLNVRTSTVVNWIALLAGQAAADSATQILQYRCMLVGACR